MTPPRAWVRQKGTLIWHHTKIRAVDAPDGPIVTRCERVGIEWDRAAPIPGAGAQICRDCVIAEEFDQGEKVNA